MINKKVSKIKKDDTEEVYFDYSNDETYDEASTRRKLNDSLSEFYAWAKRIDECWRGEGNLPVNLKDLETLRKDLRATEQSIDGIRRNVFRLMNSLESK